MNFTYSFENLAVSLKEKLGNLDTTKVLDKTVNEVKQASLLGKISDFKKIFNKYF